MGAEIGATTSLFAYDDAMAPLPQVHRPRGDRRRRQRRRRTTCAPTTRCSPTRADYFDQVIEIDLSTLEPLINGPHTPDLGPPRVQGRAPRPSANGWPLEISSALVGSCTNSSYEDITRAASIARQAAATGLTAKTPLLVTPGSEQVRATIERDGLLADLEAIGATVLANACGPCIGQWQRDDVKRGRRQHRSSPRTTATSRKRNDGLAVDAGVRHLARDGRGAGAGRPPRLRPADRHAHQRDGDAGQPRGAGRRRAAARRASSPGEAGFIAPPADGSRRRGRRSSPTSDRLQLLEPFPAWDGNDFVDLPVLLKAKGKCTTDHISAAGPWLKYRGHLENISGNLFLGAINAFTGEAGTGKDQLDGETKPFPDIAKHYHEAGQGWVAIGDENYGEGSSREHAAMEPRFRGAKAVITRSFARIHEANLKKQGVLPLTFADPPTTTRSARTTASRSSASPTSRPTCRSRVRHHQARRHHRRVPRRSTR